MTKLLLKRVYTSSVPGPIQCKSGLDVYTRQKIPRPKCVENVNTRS